MTNIKKPRGTLDILPAETRAWRYVEDMIRKEAAASGFEEIRFPTFESTELFDRGVGGTTDIVQKEMYTFTDRDGRSLSLRPEGTAGVARSVIENGLYAGAMPLKLYYLTNFFRYEKPQAGRSREFFQFGTELYGADGPEGDAEVITLADRVAHKTIREYLGPTRIPILSEEGREMRYEERRNWELYWLVDPLDGTVEFIKGNNEFTVNIALMENNVCMGAVIYVPYFEKMYIAGRDSGSYLKEHIAPDAAAEYTYDEIVRNWTPLPLAGEGPHDHPRVALSRSHQTPETREHVARLRERHPDLEIVEQGSSYKFCLLAEGRVDYYVRTTHTYEWDTAAGELILAEAGGSTRTLPDGRELLYNEEDLRNPWFVCRSKFSKI